MFLINQLVKEGIIKKDKANALKDEIKKSGKREEEVILSRKIVPEEFLFELKSKYLNIPLIKISPEDVSSDVIRLIPEETAEYYKMVALSRKGNVLEIGMVYPEDLNAQEALKFLSRREKFISKVFLITPTTFYKFLNEYKTFKKEIGKALEELEKELEKKEITEITKIGKLVEEAPVAKVVAVIFRYAVDGKASDIHIEPMRTKLRIRFRLLGNLYSSIFLPLGIHPAIVSRIKILSNMKIDETRIPQDGRFTARVGGKDIDFRVSTFPTSLGEKVAVRVLDPTIGLRKIEETGLTGRNLRVIKKAISKPYGLILVTGPTGSGKSTTLYSILQILNKESVNIVTLEDPIEYDIEGINQSQVRPEIGYDFAKGLRHILRQDPDVIMVGEIRDSETANLATHAALTGHIVLSTLHTNDALGVVPRLIDLGIQPFLIPPSLSVSLSQRLVRRLCDHCKKKVKASKEVRNLIIKAMKDLPNEIKSKIKEPFYVWKAVGCSKCRNEGYSGRIAIFEVLEMTDQLAQIVLREPSEESISREAKRQGMIKMRQDGILKVLKGITTIEEVIKETV